MYDFTNVDPVKCCTWLVLPTVYDESLSYGEQLNKFCKALNELIENNNNIPDYVAEMIQNYITSGAIDEVVRNILASYILNVKYPPKGISPAVGDGSADDTEAIQGCIDYAFNQGGGCVYLPYGKYLSRSLTLRSGVSLVGFDRYSTKVVQRGGDTKPLLSGGNVQNVQIANLTLDGNNEVQTDDLDVVNVLGKDVLLTNLVIKSGYQCLVYNGLGGDLQVNNVVFGGAVKKVAVINGKDSVQFENVKFNELGKIQGECVLEVGASDGTYRFSSKAVAPVCIIANGNRNSFECDIINSTNNYVDNGSMNNFNILGVEVKEQLAKGKSNSVGGSVTESVSGSKTENIGNGKVENITGSKTETISENKTENITGNREIDIDGSDSTHVDGVSSVNIGGARTEVYGNSRNVGVTGINTEEYHDTMTETFNSKHNVVGKDETNIFTGDVSYVANNFNFNSATKKFNIKFPDKTVDLYNFNNKDIVSIKDYGAIGDGITNDYNAIKKALSENKTIFIPNGTYLIDNTLIITPNTTIIGESRNAIIKLIENTNTTMLKNDLWDANKDTDNHEIGMQNITLFNFTLNGNRRKIYNDEKSQLNNTDGDGINIYGGGLIFCNLYVYNCAKNGIVTEWNSYVSNNKPETTILPGESLFLYTAVKYNGNTGWLYYGPHDSFMSNCIIASNSKNANNTYSNLRIGKKGNLKIDNCHFYSDYSFPKARHALYLDANAYSCTVSNCHIEGGAYASLSIFNKINQFSNCNIYASFGFADIQMGGSDNIFTNCIFGKQAIEENNPETFEWKGAIVFEKDKGKRTIMENCYLNDTCLFVDPPTITTTSKWFISGWNNSYINNKCANFNDNNNTDIMFIQGDFGSQSEFYYYNKSFLRDNVTDN